jgi:hypothetical protein
MPQPLGDRFRVHPGHEKEGGRGVPEVVRVDPGEARQFQGGVEVLLNQNVPLEIAPLLFEKTYLVRSPLALWAENCHSIACAPSSERMIFLRLALVFGSFTASRKPLSLYRVFVMDSSRVAGFQSDHSRANNSP